MIPMMMVIALANFSIATLLLRKFIFLFCFLFVFLFFIGRYYAKKLPFLTFYAPWNLFIHRIFENKKESFITTLFLWCQWEQLHQVSNCSRPDHYQVSQFLSRRLFFRRAVLVLQA